MPGNIKLYEEKVEADIWGGNLARKGLSVDLGGKGME